MDLYLRSLVLLDLPIDLIQITPCATNEVLSVGQAIDDNVNSLEMERKQIFKMIDSEFFFFSFLVIIAFLCTFCVMFKIINKTSNFETIFFELYEPKDKKFSIRFIVIGFVIVSFIVGQMVRNNIKTGDLI